MLFNYGHNYDKNNKLKSYRKKKKKRREMESDINDTPKLINIKIIIFSSTQNFLSVKIKCLIDKF
jgi:hypothetical protein